MMITTLANTTDTAIATVVVTNNIAITHISPYSRRMKIGAGVERRREQ